MGCISIASEHSTLFDVWSVAVKTRSLIMHEWDQHEVNERIVVVIDAITNVETQEQKMEVLLGFSNGNGIPNLVLGHVLQYARGNMTADNLKEEFRDVYQSLEKCNRTRIGDNLVYCWNVAYEAYAKIKQETNS